MPCILTHVMHKRQPQYKGNKMIKICKDCRYFIASPVSNDTIQEYATCSNSGKINPVTGEIKEIYCDINRRDHNACGPEGRLYEVGILPICNKVLQNELLTDASNALTSAGMFGDLVRKIDQFLGENHANNIK